MDTLPAAETEGVRKCLLKLLGSGGAKSGGIVRHAL